MKQFTQVLIDGKWQTGPTFPLTIIVVQTITCDEILYGHIYSIFIIAIMDIQLLMDGIVERYIDYQMTNGNGLKSESFQKYEIISKLHR